MTFAEIRRRRDKLHLVDFRLQTFGRNAVALQSKIFNQLWLTGVSMPGS
jgi:hypothetical protein